VGAHQHSCYHATQGCLYRRDFDAPCETRWLRAQKRRTPWPENRAPTRFPFPWMALSDLRVFVFAERAAAADGAGGSSAAAPGVSGPMKSAAEVEESPPYMSTSSSQFMASLPADIAAPCPARRCTEGDPLVVLLGYKPQPAQAQTHPQRHKQSVSVSRLGAGNKHTRACVLCAAERANTLPAAALLPPAPSATADRSAKTKTLRLLRAILGKGNRVGARFSGQGVRLF